MGGGFTSLDSENATGKGRGGERRQAGEGKWGGEQAGSGKVKTGQMVKRQSVFLIWKRRQAGRSSTEWKHPHTKARGPIYDIHDANKEKPASAA